MSDVELQSSCISVLAWLIAAVGAGLVLTSTLITPDRAPLLQVGGVAIFVLGVAVFVLRELAD